MTEEQFLSKCWLWLSENTYVNEDGEPHRTDIEVVALMREALSQVPPSPNGLAVAIHAEDEAWGSRE